MSITLENSTNTIDFGSDSSITRKSANALSTPGEFDASALVITGSGQGLTFPDSSVQTKAAVVPTLVSAFTNDAGYLTSAPSPSVVFNNVFRYQVWSTTGQAVWLTSMSTLFQNIAWTRVTTVMTVFRTAHGHSVGDRVLMKYSNVPFINALITSVATDSYTISCADTGATSGSGASYGLGYTWTYTGTSGAYSGGTVVNPSGNYSLDLQLTAIRIHLAANTRSATTFNVTIPNYFLTGISASSGMDDVFLPQQTVRQDSVTLPAVGNTLATSIAGNFQTFQFAAIPAVTTGIHIIMSF